MVGAHGSWRVFFYEIWQAHCPCIKKRRTNKVRIQKSAAAEKTNRNTEKEERPKLLSLKLELKLIHRGRKP
jgi:hypothetical protein